MLEYLKVDFGGEDGNVVCLQSGQLIAEKIMRSARWFREMIVNIQLPFLLPELWMGGSWLRLPEPRCPQFA